MDKGGRMICQKCNNKGILNTVLGKDFFYCRNCKDEISNTEESLNRSRYWAGDSLVYSQNPVIQKIRQFDCDHSLRVKTLNEAIERCIECDFFVYSTYKKSDFLT